MISQGLIDSLKRLAKEKGGKISDIEARDGAERLVGFFELLIKVDHRNKQKENSSKN